MAVKYKEVPGSAYGSQLAYQKALIRFAEKINLYEASLEHLFEDDVVVTGLTIRHPLDEGEDYLITMRAIRAGEKIVAFHDGSSMFEVLEGLVNRLRNKSLRWKKDKYAD